MQNDLVEVAKYRSSIEASWAQDQLEEAGITVRLANKASAAMLTHLGDDDVGVGVLVLRNDAAKAKQLLAEHTDGDDSRVVEQPSETLSRAWRAAILGIVFSPLSVYSLWLLLRHNLLSKDPAIGNRRAYATLALDIVGIGIGLLFLIGSIVE